MSPIHYATYFDRHYLTRGLALVRSLHRHSPPFVLWVLCLDDETHRMLSGLRLENLVLVPLSELERDDRALRATRESRRAVEYYWTCGPAFLRYLFDRQLEVELLTYLDADLFFFGDPTPIYEELGGQEILLVEHRWSKVRDLSATSGIYNVGLLMFRRTPGALDCLAWWRERCLEWCSDRSEEGRYGDQKYLEQWPTRFDGVTVLRHKGAGLARWNVDNYRFRLEGGRVFVDDDPLVFYHFNALRRVTHWLYDPDMRRYGYSLHPIVKRQIYVPYIRELRVAEKLIRAAGGEVPVVDSLRSTEPKVRRLARMLRTGDILVVTDSFAL